MNYNKNLIIALFAMIFCSISYSQNLTTKFSIDNQITIGETLTLESKIFNEKRTIFVSLPAGYATDRTSYPVIYFTDGSLVRLRLFRGIVGFLTNLGKMPDAILVGIVHSNRDKELTPNDPVQVNQRGEKYTVDNCGGADQLISFIKQELFPVIESQYRTLPSRIFVGWSYGGIFGLYSLLKDPYMFNAQIAVDPSYWWKEQAYTDSLGLFIKKNPKFQYSLYASRAGQREFSTFGKLHTILEKHSILNLPFRYDYLELPATETHQSSLLPTLYPGLIKIFEDYPVTIDSNMTFEKLKAHFTKPVLGGKYNLTETIVNEFGYTKLQSNKFNEAIAAFKYNVAQNPGSSNVYDSLGECYEHAGLLKDALLSYNKAVELAQINKDPNLNLFKTNYDRVNKLQEKK
jgi:uncharacterized protein